MGRIVAYSAAALAVIAVIAVTAFFAINASDEALSPQAKQLLTRAENPYAPERNLYLAMVGFDAPPGVSTITVGQERRWRTPMARPILRNWTHYADGAGRISPWVSGSLDAAKHELVMETLAPAHKDRRFSNTVYAVDAMR